MSVKDLPLLEDLNTMGVGWYKLGDIISNCPDNFMLDIHVLPICIEHNHNVQIFTDMSPRNIYPKIYVRRFYQKLDLHVKYSKWIELRAPE